MIQIVATGRLGKEATVNTVNGKNVINFSIAHSEKYKDQEKTTWIEASYWSEKTGIVPFLTKGQQVLITGTPEVRSFVKKDGTAGASLNVRVDKIELLGSKQEATPATASAGGTNPEDLDLPF